MQAGQDGRGAITGINVTPLVDVILVILIIFMATAPLIARRAIKVDVPRAERHERAVPDALPVALDASRRLTLAGRPVTVEELKAKLSAAIAARPDQPVTVAADRGLPYGEIVTLLDAVRSAGVRKVGLEVVRK